MRQEPYPVRGLALLLCASLLTAASGCVTAEQRAGRPWNRLGPGQSQEDVLALAGRGETSVDSDGLEVWHYSFGTVPDPGLIAETGARILCVLTIVGVFVLMLAAVRADGTNLNPDFGGVFPGFSTIEVASGRVHFRVGFDRSGRVKEISGLEPCPD